MKSYGVTIQMKPFLKVVTSKGAIYLSMETFRVTFTANGKRQTWICTRCPSFPFTCRFLFIASTTKLPDCFTLVLTIRILLSCFYLLISYFGKFSTWIWRLLFAVNVALNLSYVVRFFQSKDKVSWFNQSIETSPTALCFSSIWRFPRLCLES